MREFKLKFVMMCVLVVVAGLAVSPLVGENYINPGTDHWTTVEPTEVVFGSNSLPAIPADFFFPGSEPFTGTVCLQSKPIDPCTSNADTYIRRQSSGNPTPDCNIPIELIELSLVSRAPIRIDFPAESFFDVFVTINPTPPSTGELKVTKKDPNGGTFDMTLDVRYRFEFTRVDSNESPKIWEPNEPVTVKSSFFYEWKDEPLQGSVPAGNNFYPVKGEPHIMDLARGAGRHSIEPAVDGNDYEWKPADLIPYGIRLKWAQPPVVRNIWDPNLTYYGWNVYSEFAADDFWCQTTDPITMIRWWGSFENWHDEMVPEPNDLPPRFRLTIWTDVPADYADPESYSHPGGIIHTIDCNNYEVEFFGWEEDPWTGAKTTKFQFTQYLDPNDYWEQPGDWDIYWLGIEALYGYNECADCNADFDGDGDVDVDDADIFFGTCHGLPPEGQCEQADLNCDGVIDGDDTAIFLCQMSAGWLDPTCCTGSPVVPEHRFGWETRTHYFMDDAVAGYIDPDTNDLSCGPIKDQEDFSWDLSFKLGTGEVKEPVRHVKWSQPPIETVPMHETPHFYGYDMWAFTPWEDPENPEPLYWVCLADDFRCIGSMPVTSIHWWGSYYNWTEDYYLYYKMPPVQPSSWWIGFWSNTFEDPCDMLPWGRWSRPHELLWEIKLDSNRVEEVWVGDDVSFDHPDPNWLDFSEDVCFQYFAQLEPNEHFWQDDFNSLDDVYWISIIADYNEPVYAFPWGWKTRPKVWMDSSVLFWMTGDPWVGMELGPEHWLTNQPPIVFRFGGPLFYIDRFWDLSFEIDTDPNYIKWEQPFTGLRDWAHYEDVNSWAIDDGEPNITGMVVADDWLCRRRTPVTSIVWWGSYLDYAYNPSEPNFLGMPPPNKPDYFLIYFWTDMPVDDPCNMLGYSYPRQKVWEYRAYEYDEVFLGYDKHVKYRYPLATRQEAVFRYSVRIPEEDWFCQPKIDGIYWISIVAIYDQFNPPTYKWGWTNHQHVFNDDAVSGRPLPCDGEWEWLVEVFDQTGESADMSFVLFTDPNACNQCADYNIDGVVDNFDLDVFTDNWLWVGLPGGFNDGDLNCDGKVKFDDFAILAMVWLESCL